MKLEVADKNVVKVMTLSNNLVFIYRFQNHNRMNDSWKMCFLLKYSLWKLQLELWNTNHKLLNWTLFNSAMFTDNWLSCRYHFMPAMLMLLLLLILRVGVLRIWNLPKKSHLCLNLFEFHLQVVLLSLLCWCQISNHLHKCLYGWLYLHQGT